MEKAAIVQLRSSSLHSQHILELRTESDWLRLALDLFVQPSGATMSPNAKWRCSGTKRVEMQLLVTVPGERSRQKHADARLIAKRVSFYPSRITIQNWRYGDF